MSTSSESSSMSTVTMLVTPQQAAVWLKGNVRNRKIGRRAVGRLVKAIQSGQWAVTHQGIAFASDMELLDGQHRLMAIVEADIAVHVRVTFDVPKGSRTAMDVKVRGPRNLGDVLGLSKRVAAISYQMMIGLSNADYTHGDQQDFYHAHCVAIDFADSVCGSGVQNMRRAAIPAAIARASYHIDRSRLTQFATVLYGGAEAITVIAPGYRTALQLREQIREGQQTTTRAMYACVERAVRAFADGRDLKIIRPVAVEEFPLPEAQS